VRHSYASHGWLGEYFIGGGHAGAARKKYTFSNLADFQTTAPPAVRAGSIITGAIVGQCWLADIHSPRVQYDVMQSIARIPHHFDEGVLTQPAPVHMPLPQYTQYGARAYPAPHLLCVSWGRP
jgi:hypothetical protein